MRSIRQFLMRPFSPIAHAVNDGNGSLLINRELVVLLVDGRLVAKDANADKVYFEMHFANNLGEKYLRIFLKCLVNAFQKTSANSDYSRNDSLSVRYYKDLSEDTVFSILDSREMSPSVKFAAIVSMLSICPSLPFRDVKSIAIQQYPFISEQESVNSRSNWIEDRDPRVKSLGDLKIFLMPNFIGANRRYYPSHFTRRMENPEYFRMFRSLADFFCNGGNTTYEEYMSKAGNEIYRPTPIEGESWKSIKSALEYVESLEEPVINDLLLTLKPSDLQRFCAIYKDQHPDLFPFLKTRITDTRLCSESDRSDYGWFSEDMEQIESISSFVDEDEMWEIHHEVSQDNELYEAMNELCDFGAPIAVYYYLNYGIDAVKELMQLVKNDPNHSGFFGYGLSYKSNDIQSQKIMQINFIIAKTGEYSSMPLEWAINLVGAE